MFTAIFRLSCHHGRSLWVVPFLGEPYGAVPFLWASPTGPYRFFGRALRGRAVLWTSPTGPCRSLDEPYGAVPFVWASPTGPCHSWMSPTGPCHLFGQTLRGHDVLDEAFGPCHLDLLVFFQ